MILRFAHIWLHHLHMITKLNPHIILWTGLSLKRCWEICTHIVDDCLRSHNLSLIFGLYIKLIAHTLLYRYTCEGALTGILVQVRNFLYSSGRGAKKKQKEKEKPTNYYCHQLPIWLICYLFKYFLFDIYLSL